MDIAFDPKTRDIKIEPSFQKHIGKSILQTLKSKKDGVHQIDVATGNIETHGSVLTRSIRVAEALKAKGLKIGDVVMICAVNHNDASIPFISSMYLGTIPVCLAVGMTYEEVKHIASFARPRIVFSDMSMVDIIKRAMIDLKLEADFVVFGLHDDKSYTPFSDLLKSTGTEEDFKCEEFDPETTTAFAVCSSGSTGLPKLVAISHAAMQISIMLPMVLMKTQRRTRLGFQNGYLCFSSMYWVSGLMTILSTCIHGFPRLHSSTPSTWELIKKSLESYKPSFMFLSPAALYDLEKSPEITKIDFSCLDGIYVGGSAVSANIIKSLQERLPNGAIVVAYGATEVGGISTNPQFVKESVGKIYPWLKWKIVDTDTEECLGPNITGELRIKTLTIFQKYFNDPASTKNAFDSEGYYKTGDLLYYDEEGYFYFVDRCKEIIKYANYQISTCELESKICTLPEVLMAAVVGVPDPAHGELPMAFVQLTPGSKISAQRIKDIIKDSYSDYKQLRGGVVFVDQLPLTHSGKLNRKTLNSMKLTMKGE